MSGAIIAAVTPLAPDPARPRSRSSSARPSCARSARATASAGCWRRRPMVTRRRGRRCRRGPAALRPDRRPDRRRGRVRGRRPPAARLPPDAARARATVAAGASIEDRREAVPFEVREGLDAIAIDADALDDGLVVMPRESVGTAGRGPRPRPGRDAAGDPGPAARRPGLVGRARDRRSASRPPDADGAAADDRRARAPAHPHARSSRTRRCASSPAAIRAGRSRRR